MVSLVTDDSAHPATENVGIPQVRDVRDGFAARVHTNVLSIGRIAAGMFGVAAKGWPMSGEQGLKRLRIASLRSTDQGCIRQLGQSAITDHVPVLV